MEPAARENYLAAEVRTAPPQKLHLLLLEAAIRSAQRARQHWLAGDPLQGGQDLIHAQRVMSEIMAGLDHRLDWEPSRKLAAVYAFVHRRLVEAARQHDAEKLAEALRVLEIERRTWRDVCERLTREASAVPPPHAAAGDCDMTSMSTGISLEA